jgi:hypothetical protein
MRGQERRSNPEAVRETRKESQTMKCKECKKKISFDHYLATNRPHLNHEKLHLVFKCDCGIYVIPLDLVETTKFKGLFSLESIKHLKIANGRKFSGKKLSEEAMKIYKEQGEEAYEKWKKEVYFPLMDSKLKKIKENCFRKRV